MKEKYLEFIKNFSSISVSKICKDKKIDRSCVMRGRSSEQRTKELYDELLKQLKELIENEAE